MRAGLLAVSLLAACAAGRPGDGGDGTAADAAPGRVDAAPGQVVDAEPGARADATPATPDAMLAAPDTCAAARDLTDAAGAAGGATVTGDTTGYANDTQPPGSCTGFTPDGPDAIYAVDAVAGETIVASVASAGWDVSLFIAATCAFDAACLIGADSGGATEAVQWTVAATGTYYVVVESWDPGAFGAYTLSVELQ